MGQGFAPTHPTAAGDMVEKPSYTIDGLACRDFAATVAEFNRVFGRWWGEGYWDGHLDVFNDILFWVGDGEPYALIWADSATARKHLGREAMTDWLTKKLGQCAPGFGGDWRKQLAQAEKGKGPTLFDWLVEIIAGNRQIELRLG